MKIVPIHIMIAHEYTAIAVVTRLRVETSLPNKSIDQLMNSAQRYAFQLGVLLIIGLLLVNGCQRSSKKGKSQAGTQASVPAKAKNAEEAIARSIDYLMSKQAEDGGWHSEVYGGLRGGAATTCLVLYSLAYAPAEYVDPHHEQLLKAGDFLKLGLDEKGFASNPDGSPDYSNYASAMLLIANDRLDLELSKHQQQRLVNYLLAAQLDSEHGYDSDSPEFGGWDLMGWMEPPKETAGTNISVTRLVVEALVIYSRQDDVREALRRAEDWLGGCSTRDGGFCFHPRQSHDGNKAGWYDDEREEAVAYGTATADGLRILQVLNVQADDPRREGAIDWLTKNAKTKNKVPGFEEKVAESGWDQGLLWYYEFALSTTINNFPSKTQAYLAQSVVKRLVAEQNPEGFWENKSTRMREDDPLIATSFALIALSNLAPYVNEPS